MEWKTIYIVGKDGFGEDVQKNLNRSEIKFMAGYHTGEVAASHELFWIGEKTPLRDFKKAIGAKTIFKFRLRFYHSLEDFIETLSDPNTLTDDERRRVDEMRMSERMA